MCFCFVFCLFFLSVLHCSFLCRFSSFSRTSPVADNKLSSTPGFIHSSFSPFFAHSSSPLPPTLTNLIDRTAFLSLPRSGEHNSHQPDVVCPQNPTSRCRLSGVHFKLEKMRAQASRWGKGTLASPSPIIPLRLCNPATRLLINWGNHSELAGFSSSPFVAKQYPHGDH